MYQVRLLQLLKFVRTDSNIMLNTILTLVNLITGVEEGAYVNAGTYANTYSDYDAEGIT